MKKIFLIVFVLFCVSCEKDNALLQQDENNDNKEEVQTEFNYRISIDDAINEVNSLLDAIDNNTGNGSNNNMMRAKHYRTIKDISVITNKPESDVMLMNNAITTEFNSLFDTIAYIMNFTNNEGFAIASADSRLEPVLCITDEGSFYIEDTIENPGLAMFLAGLEGYITERVPRNDDIYEKPGPIDDGPSCNIGNWEIVAQIQEKMTTRWDQNAPYNNNCPINFWKLINTGITERYYTGCVATALAQIMSYYQYPLTHGTFTYNWTEMLKLGSYPSYNHYL
jgi:hypothetical protein